jgi:hypothetical protein
MKGGSYAGSAAVIKGGSRQWRTAKDDGEVCSLLQWWSSSVN